VGLRTGFEETDAAGMTPRGAATRGPELPLTAENQAGVEGGARPTSTGSINPGSGPATLVSPTALTENPMEATALTAYLAGSAAPNTLATASTSTADASAPPPENAGSSAAPLDVVPPDATPAIGNGDQSGTGGGENDGGSSRMPETDTPPDTPPNLAFLPPFPPQPEKPQPKPNNDCDSGTVGTSADAPGLASDAAFSEAPVRYFDGTVKLSWTDLSSDGLGGWGQTRSWTNAPGYAAIDFAGHPMGYNGSGMVVSQLPFVETTNNYNTAIVVTSGTNALFFDNLNDPNPTPRFFVQDRLAHVGREFILTDTLGDQIHFNDFTGAPNDPRWGKFNSVTDADGNVTAVTAWTADGRPAEVQQSTPSGPGPHVVESYLYSYVPSGVNQGLYSNVTLRRQVDGGAWTVVRQVDYTYYGSQETNGNPTDLKTAVVKDAAGNALDTTYYRYYPTRNGFDGLKYVFTPQSYARLAAAVGDPFTASDAQVAPYADNYFEYDVFRRVTREIARGSNCGCTGLPGDYTFVYSTNSNPTDYNTWKYKTIETRLAFLEEADRCCPGDRRRHLDRTAGC
jgi:hypothetical protein